MVFCDVRRERGHESKGIGKTRECEAKRVIQLVQDIMKDPAGKNLSIGVITFYAAQRDLIFHEASIAGLANLNASGDYEIDESVKATKDGKERLRIGTVDSFQGKEFDVVILSTTRSNSIERIDENVLKVFGFLTSENRLNVAFSRAQRLLIVCGDSAMFNDEYAQAHVKGLYEFYMNQSTNASYGSRII
jgi:superfamily I DNA and/or RNA helicase